MLNFKLKKKIVNKSFFTKFDRASVYASHNHHLHSIQQNSDHHGFREGTMLRPSYWDRPLLLDDLRRPLPALDACLRLAQGGRRPRPLHLLLGDIHQDEQDITDIQSGGEIHQETFLHVT